MNGLYYVRDNPSTEIITFVILAARIRKILVSEGSGQTELAKAVGISQAALNNYAAGRIPKAEQLCKFADYFGVTVDELLGRSVDLCLEIKENATSPDQKKTTAKLRRQVQNMQLQIDAITETLNELERP